MYVYQNKNIISIFIQYEYFLLVIVLGTIQETRDIIIH